MNPNTQAMERICNRWSGRFADAMKHVARHCDEYDKAFSNINQELSNTAGEWQDSAKRTANDAEKQREEHEWERSRTEKEWSMFLSRRRELRQKMAPLTDKLQKYTGKTIEQIRQERKRRKQNE